MVIPTHPYLRAAHQWIQNGEKEKARNLLRSFLAQEPTNVEAWFLLSQTVDEPAAIALCLHQILGIDPHHDVASKMTKQLAQQFNLKPLPVMQVGVDSAAAGENCPYCSSPFNLPDKVVACPNCEISHHLECWQENGHRCAARLCYGFSLSEVEQPPLPVQPPKPKAQAIVLREEDIPGANPVSRKEQEQRFQEDLLLRVLMVEKGLLPPDFAHGLPSLYELLTILQKDRATDQPLIAQQPPIGSRPPSAAMPSQCCRACGHAYPRAQSRFCMICGEPRFG